ncbi:hypothetical protein Taro_022865 [Colocasia esculenta]|uniref:NAD-dependent epimerase/dehydratase domain-containing protein n=1 Tax=Colocasia esculenta TaxID=4460 RepID=A0A843V6L1_COLES|nr:hypothetical protein [Colocasia esculenta]
MPVDAAAASPSGKTVCVTGAGGFVASWLVKLLLEKGYTVKGTVRNPGVLPLLVSRLWSGWHSFLLCFWCSWFGVVNLVMDADDPKNSHLKELEGAKERLVLCRADLLDYESLRSAIEGCDGVFHTASPVTDDPEQMMEPAVKGSRYVVEAAAAAGVRRVVLTSSIGAVHMDPNRPADAVVDESCWSDLEFCKATKNWYCYGKAMAEREAWMVAREKGVELVVVIPVLVLGPLLQSALNVSSLHVLKYLSGSAKTFANSVQAYVDVRDVAAAHVLVYESPAAEPGRYMTAESVLHRGDVVDILARLFPEYSLPTK